jgi:hypothetical protein
MIIRFILFLILFYLIYNIGRKFLRFIIPRQPEVKGNPKKGAKKFDPEDIEDIDYEEVKDKKE